MISQLKIIVTLYINRFLYLWVKAPVHSSVITVKRNKWLYSKQLKTCCVVDGASKERPCSCSGVPVARYWVDWEGGLSASLNSGAAVGFSAELKHDCVSPLGKKTPENKQRAWLDRVLLWGERETVEKASSAQSAVGAGALAAFCLPRQNHSMVRVGRDLCGSPIQPPCPSRVKDEAGRTSGWPAALRSRLRSALGLARFLRKLSNNQKHWAGLLNIPGETWNCLVGRSSSEVRVRCASPWVAMCRTALQPMVGEVFHRPRSLPAVLTGGRAGRRAISLQGFLGWESRPTVFFPKQLPPVCNWSE